MRRALVTGGTGFLGLHVVHALESRGVEVVTVARGAGATHRGSILDPALLERAMNGCDAVFHLAGRVDRSRHAMAVLTELHVHGTLAVLEAAARAGISRVVYASTSGTIAVSRDPLKFHTEQDPPPTDLVAGWPYYATKLQAEQAAFRSAASLDLERVSVNPSLLLGPEDHRGSSTTDVADVLQGRVPALPSGGLSFVDVRDVATAAVSAWERGTPGARYLLGAANWSLDRFIGTVAELGGVRAPRWRAPDRPVRWLARMSAPVFERMSLHPPLDPISIEMSQHFWYFDSGLAQRELAFLPRDPTETLRETIAWLRSEAT